MDSIVTVRDIARDMFVPGSAHMQRMEMLGRHFSEESLCQKRFFMRLIIGQFGERGLETLSLPGDGFSFTGAVIHPFCVNLRSSVSSNSPQERLKRKTLCAL